MPVKRNVLVLVVFVLAIACLPMKAFAGPPTIKEVECGIYTAKIDKVVKSKEFGYTSSISEVRFVEHTDRIPAKLGIQFGCRIELSGDEKQYEILKRMILPKTISWPSTGNSANHADSKLIVGPERRESGFAFDEEAELVPGTWILEFEHKGTVLFRKAFTVYKP